ncbi:YHS domain-containing (seleno)protein [Fontibacter flavus]|uniref:YHS domain-containing (Seleno)protein n=1 Tax=Fontibacter flavus TaxID=654838 RepID=A0ABV6FX49_9BACT
MNNFQSLLIKATLIFSFAFVTIQIYAQEGHIYSSRGYALSGYDAVAYFTQNKAVIGDKDKYSHKFEGVYYAFSSLENYNLFKANPKKYQPQYGGYCSYAMATKGSKVSADPEAFEVRDGKLHVFYRKQGLENWKKEGPIKLRSQADANWRKIIYRR